MARADPHPLVRLECDDAVLRVVLDAPDRKNRADAAGMAALADAAREVNLRPDGTRVVHLRAEGPHFCAGGDLAAGVGLGETRAIREQILAGPQAAIAAWWDVDLPVVAAVQGHAAGFGACLALTADVIIAAESAVFRFPFAQLGFGPDSGASWLLPRRLGLSAATALLFSGDALDARAARAAGIVHAVVSDDELDRVADDHAKGLARGATAALRQTKRLLRAAGHGSLEQALTAEAEAFEKIATTHDFREGIQAFLDRRFPDFTGT